ncbi:MAG: PCRF domain-containing protein [Candidatus Nealsonbacteria bacterium]
MEQQSEAVIIEIRAGAGGDEAAFFAAQLYRMYSRYALSQNWPQRVFDSNPTGIGGFKHIVFELKGRDAYQKMQNEGGVHRVQRIPQTEKSGRVHTSTATVAVLLKPKKTQIKINPNDLRVEVCKSSGPGGQNVNKRMTAVRIVHLPTNIVVTSQAERSLLQNKENAMSVLEAKLLEKQEMDQMESLGEKRKEQIKWARRADKIRTYNFPQDRVTDHRIQKNFHDIESIINGCLDKIVKVLNQSL